MPRGPHDCAPPYCLTSREKRLFTAAVHPRAAPPQAKPPRHPPYDATNPELAARLVEDNQRGGGVARECSYCISRYNRSPYVRCSCRIAARISGVANGFASTTRKTVSN